MSDTANTDKKTAGGRLASAWSAIDLWIDRRFGGGADAVSLAHSFRPDVAAIEDGQIPISMYAALYVVIAFIVVAILWSVFGTVDRIVVTQGKIVTTAPVIVLQPFTTSRILKIDVKAGDRVHKGDTLVTFDPAFAQADEASLEQKVRALTAEIDRINAELTGQKTFPPGVNADPERRTQSELFTQRMSQLNSELAVRDSRQKQIDAQIDSDTKSIEGLTHQLDIAHKVTEVRRQLEAKQAGSILELMAAEKDEVDLDVRLESAMGDKEKQTQQRVENLAERQSFYNHWRGDLSERLNAARQELAQSSEALNKARRLKNFADLTSPVDGIVLELADRSEGSVLREAETLVTLVPDNAELRLDTSILSRDVGFVSTGDAVRIKFEAYPFQQFGTVDGTLDVISPDSLPLKEGEQTTVVFRGQIGLKETVGGVAGRGIRVRPGLVATAEIKAGTRSIASYILDPLVQTFDESLREP